MQNPVRAFSDRELRTVEAVAVLNIKGFERSEKHLPENRNARRLKHKGTIMLSHEP